MGAGNGQNATRTRHGGVGGRAIERRAQTPGPRGVSGDRRGLPGARRVAMLAVLRPDQHRRSASSTTPTSVSVTPSGIGARWRSRCTSTAFSCSAAGSTSCATTSTRRATKVDRGARAPRLVAAAQLAAVREARRPLGSILRAEALADPGNAAAKFEQAAELKVPAALAVDSVRHAIVDADARMRWATCRVGADPGRRIRRRVGVGQHRTTQRTRRIPRAPRRFQRRADETAPSTNGLDAATAAVPVEAADEYALVAAGSASASGGRADPARSAAAACGWTRTSRRS